MVELQLPKLVTGVRFPSPALLFRGYPSRSDWLLASFTPFVVCRRLVVSFNLSRPSRGPSLLLHERPTVVLGKVTFTPNNTIEESCGFGRTIKPLEGTGGLYALSGVVGRRGRPARLEEGPVARCFVNYCHYFRQPPF